MLQQYEGQVPDAELDKQRWKLVEKLLPPAIEVKIVYLDFLRSMKPEQIESVRASIYEQFDEKQLPELIERAKVSNLVELEEKMREVGASLDKTRRGFFEQVAAREVIRRNSSTKEITPADLLAYYRNNLDQYAIDATAKWEHLMVRSSPTDDPSTRADAYRKLARMGNAVIGGASVGCRCKTRQRWAKFR